MVKKYYTKENFDKDGYTTAQVKRHSVKVDQRRSVADYKAICEGLTPFLPQGLPELKMLCLGTRNNWERDRLSLYLKKTSGLPLEVYSLDIAPASNADYIMDFNSFPSDWENKWDIIYSNAIDHSISSDDCFKEWIRILKPGGLMYTDWETQKARKKYTPTAADCCIFSDGAVRQVMKDNFFNIEILSEKIGRNEGCWLIQKKPPAQERGACVTNFFR